MNEKLRKARNMIAHFRKSISTKVVLIILILVLPLNILAIMLSHTAIDAMTEQAKLSVTSVMENYITELQNRMEDAGYLLWNMKNEDTDGTILARQAGDEQYLAAKVRFYHKLLNNMRMADGADGYFFYMVNLDDIIVWDSTGANKISGEKFAKGEIEKGITPGWNVYTVDGRPILCMFVNIRDVIYGGWIYLDNITTQLSDDIQYKQSVFSFDDKPAKAVKNGMATEGKIPIAVQSRKGNAWLNATLSKSEIIGGISFIYLAMRAGAFIALILIPVLYLGISNLLLIPLRTVNNAQKRLQEGDLDYRIKENASSIEYQYSFKSFNQMARRIQTLKIENYEKELSRQEMELKNMQLQIHPHFLLNTFNLLYTLAQRNETNAVQNVAIYLSDYFRYLFRSGKNLELFPKEQRLIEGYISMASLRYPSSIEAEYVYDPEISFVRVPPLLLHNFVENIIKHVVKQNNLTHISLVGQYENRTVTFMVMDNGPGMEKEEIAALDERMRRKDMDGEHIGFSNSLKRLKYFYGETADITIGSEPGMGTCITIQFPYDLEVQNDTFAGK
ncbi:MAG TPA: histidine kinase [Clostridiales bacterium]|nr:histidine kinase [Clostridiales bacterium]